MRGLPRKTCLVNALPPEPGGDYWKRWNSYIKEVLLARKLISPADLALYKAKNEGRNCFRVYDEKLKTEADSRNALENDLRQAIEAGLRDSREGRTVPVEEVRRQFGASKDECALDRSGLE